MGCAATTTIREALDALLHHSPLRLPHNTVTTDPTHPHSKYDRAVDALVLLEQLVEAAQAYEEMRRLLAFGPIPSVADFDESARAFRAAVAAVGPGQETS